MASTMTVTIYKNRRLRATENFWEESNDRDNSFGGGGCAADSLRDHRGGGGGGVLVAGSNESLHERQRQLPLEDSAKLPKRQGLSEADLQRLPTVEFHEGEEGDERPSGCGNAECVVCLEAFQSGQRCRVIPVCRHAFHVQCADAWLSRHSVCPICRRSAYCESDEKNGANGGAAVALQEGEVRDEESRWSRPPPTAESVVVEMPVA